MDVSVAATFCATLVDEWVRAGVTDAVVAPGSRSTPMALALAGDDRMRVHMHHDERSAAFIALGLGIARGRPAVVLTTSGTAAVELHPAIVEAHHAHVPLLAVTADRPPELHDVGAPQTIDQTHLFGSVVRWYCEPGVPDAAAIASWRSIAARAVHRSMAAPPGPVHCNLAFREPLLAAPGPLPAGRDRGGAWHGSNPAAPVPDVDADAAALAAAFTGRRGIVVAGRGTTDAEAVHELASVLRWPLVADPLSGARWHRPATISHVDALLRVPSFAQAGRPDVVLRIGALPASKVLTEWLAGLDAWQVGVERNGALFDPDHSLNALVEADPGELCGAILRRLRDDIEVESSSGAIAPTVTSPGGWFEDWVQADAEAAAAIGEVLAGRPLPTEPATARDLVRTLPDGAALVVSSSMPVRDVEWYSAPREGLEIIANRGANGIDGVVSTAVGVALAGADTGRVTAALVGDVAMLHDSNALLGLALRPVNLVIVVVDNDGGGIFSFLPPGRVLDHDRFEQLFGTPHGVDIEGLARVHGITARTIEAADDVEKAITVAVDAGGVHVLRVRTDRVENVALHDELHEAVASALARLHT